MENEMTWQQREQEWNKRQKTFVRKTLAPLTGATMTGVAFSEDEAGVWTILYLTAKDGRKYALTISQDDEGNGPGSFFLDLR